MKNEKTMSKYTKDLTFGDVSDFIQTIEQTHDLLNSDFKTLTREFLNFFIEDDCLTLPLNELRDKYVDRFGINTSKFDGLPEFFEVPESEDDFYKYICKMYLFLIPNDPSNLEPKVKSIIKDLNEIEQSKTKYKKQLDDLKGNAFEEGKNYKEKLLIHYIKKQEEAEEQILSYIKNQLSRETNKNKSWLSIEIKPLYTYHYNFAPHNYKLEYLSKIGNKLRKVTVGRYFELELLYRNDKNRFLDELKKDFPLEQTITFIKESINKNNRLFQRKELLEDILSLIMENKTQLFCNVVPQQIEGILYDYCIEYGIDESSLINSTLGDKINLLKEKGDTEIGYEYFAFIFPIIRNRVAHGKLINQDIDLNSWLLLLDLKSACEWLLSPKLDSNKNLRFINGLNETIDNFTKNLVVGFYNFCVDF